MNESRIALVGEAYGEEEARLRTPFVGSSGRVLNYLLRQAGIVREECLVTNVFNLQPQPTNDIVNICGARTDALQGYPALTKGKFVPSALAGELSRLYSELTTFRPNVVIALGGTAAWALLKSSGIKAIRGAPARSFLGWKVVPTYHPAAILRDWTLNPIVLADLEKAKAQSYDPTYARPSREVWVDSTIDDLFTFEQYINASHECAVDTETIGEQITMISFAPTIDRVVIVHFYDQRKPDGNYWPTLELELQAWSWVRRQLAKRKEFTGQNFIYDMRFLWVQYGIPVPHMEHDTMLLHHALQPEMEKGLAFLGSIYTLEPAWKLEHKKNETLKRED